MAASSLSSAVKAIDESLARCEAGLSNLARRGKEHLPSFAKLKERHQQMQGRRALLGQLADAAELRGAS